MTYHTVDVSCGRMQSMERSQLTYSGQIGCLQFSCDSGVISNVLGLSLRSVSIWRLTKVQISTRVDGNH